MPYCNVTGGSATGDNGIKIFYRTYGLGPTKVLFIIGLAGTHDSWGPQIKGLTGTDVPNDAESANAAWNSADEGNCGVEACAFDNRGMGRSSVPTKRSEYTTTTMAKDAIALMDHLGWRKAHVFGHSMGGMIACKLAALVPDRIQSLALINVTGGGFECFPKLDRMTVSIAIRFVMARSPKERAGVDLDAHYTQKYLEEHVGTSTRRSILYPKYVKGISASGMQSNHGFEGQINACWTHKMTQAEIESIRSARFLISVIHGRQDIIAQIRHAKRLAQKLHPSARMVDLQGGHLVSHEKTDEVNEELTALIRASESKISPHDWTNLPHETPGWIGTWIMLIHNRALVAPLISKPNNLGLSNKSSDLRTRSPEEFFNRSFINRSHGC
ncbi:hypothetical protein Nepgr_010726 [Nepenthes gracilis]|uniref:AB hydrolase-1 domain-containing protein n=1 Tax=Nepenthes gracilis TaxID=150966 RepID=A0AAD3SDQ9_NEPGR|nr:hypothetical protein Nepgr_010726 [Nepenthes gracilis]